MSWVNYDYVQEQLVNAGLDLAADSHKRPLEFSGRIQRWRVKGEDNEFRGWTKLREWRSPKTGNLWITGSYGIWKGTDDGFQKIMLSRDGDDKVALPDPDELKAIRAAQKENQKRLDAERKIEAKTAGRWAAQVWAHCQPVTTHEYLARKCVGTHGARLMGKPEGLLLDGIDDSNYFRLTKAEGALVVPMHDEHGSVCGIQFIYPKGHERAKKIERDKEFWPSGMAMGGTFGLIGPLRRSGVLLIAEGFATAATIHEATGQSVAYAFSANNLGKAGKLIRKTCPSLRLLFCADDDYTTGDAGAKYAAQAVAEIEGTDWVKPDFLVDGQDPRDGKKLTDFNDLFMLTGLHLTVANQINAKLDALKWRDAINTVNSGGPKPPPPPTGGAGSPDGGGGGSAGHEKRTDAVSIVSLDEAAERFIFIDDKTGEYVYDGLTRSICKRSKIVKMLAAGSREDDLKRHPRWQQRAVYLDQIGFDPTLKDTNVTCNLWNGWPTVPTRGKCDLLLELLQYQCGDDEIYRWVLRWLAYPIQHPGAKMQTAIVLHGPQGTGKGRFFEWGYMPIFGAYGVYLDQDALEDKHGSDWQSCKLFVLADEVMARAEMYHQKNKLKNLVTSKRIRINPKGLIAYEETNHLNIVFLSNEKQPLVLETDDRRYCVIWTPPPVGKEFYDELSDELANGGSGALHYYLKNEVELGDFKPWTRPPMTEAKRDLINMSRDSVDRFLIDWQAGDTDLPFCPCASADLYRAYLWWCRTNGERMPRPENQFSGHIVKLQGWVKGHKDVTVEDEFGHRHPKRMRMVIPSGEALNEAAGRGGRDYRRGEGQAMIEWLTPCFFEFKAALKVDS